MKTLRTGIAEDARGVGERVVFSQATHTALVGARRKIAWHERIGTIQNQLGGDARFSEMAHKSRTRLALAVRNHA